jgi:L-ascorbate metabolism protein UlaG (beta-lactamase superfamily)
MEIAWYGHSCFRLMERGIASIVTDPYNGDIGYPVPSLKADIVTVSHNAPGHNAVHNVKKAEYILNRPGEYEIGGVFITGIPTFDPKRPPEEVRRNVIFTFIFDDVVVAHLGDLDYVPSQNEIDQLGPIDILLAPVGGGGGLNSAQASDVISLIEPSIVVPMHYKTPYCTLDLDPLDKFLKEMGVAAAEEQDALRVRKSNLTEETQVIVLRYTE